MKDTLKKYLLKDRSVRILTANLEQTWINILENHQQHHPVLRQLLGELSAAAVLLASNIKFDGSLVLQLQGDGPVALIVVECTSQLQVRATINTRQEFVIKDTDTLQTLLNSNGDGRFIMVLDPKNRPDGQQPYQGIVPLLGNTVAKVLEHYMKTSEQLDTLIYLAADQHKAAGLLCQRLPHGGGKTVDSEQSEESWVRILNLANTVKTSEQLSITEDELIHRLFWDESLMTYEPQSIQFFCTCSTERVAEMLKMLGQQEVEDILSQSDVVQVQCDFCGKPYVFDAIDSAKLFIPEVQMSLQESQKPH